MARTGSIAPRATGTLHLALPASWQSAHALLLDAHDPSGRLVGRWSWMIQKPAELRATIVDTASKVRAAIKQNWRHLVVTTADTTYTFDKSSGQLADVFANGRRFPLRNGPSLSLGSATLHAFDVSRQGNDTVITARYRGNLQEVVWRVLGTGWLALRYRYQLSGEYDFFGIDFDCAEADVLGAEWLGRGPHRVWKNRMRGPWHDLWRREKNDAVTGQRWEYPEFKGYFADVYFARLFTKAGPIEVVMDTPGLFLRLFTPADGPDPKTTAMRFPARDISFLHGIAAIGDKFAAPQDLGPQGQRHALDGSFEGELYFRFGAPP